MFNNAGTYTVKMVAVGATGCKDSVLSTVVRISDGAFADFSSEPGPNTPQSLPNAAFRFSDLSQNGVSWFWDFGDGNHSSEQNPTHLYQNPGEYPVSLTVTDSNGCVSTISYGNYLVYSPELFIPNVFTPNSDGLNDLFEVVYNGKESYNLEVFDRWGKPLFRSITPVKPGTEPSTAPTSPKACTSTCSSWAAKPTKET